MTRIALAAVLLAAAPAAGGGEYTTYRTWEELVAGDGAKYAELVRVSDPGTAEHPVYTGFWFFGIQQFDRTDRYALAMRVDFQNRAVTAADRAEVGVIDLQGGNAWRTIGTTTAWNWQQGCRLQWRPRSDEILWNDRSDDGTHFVCRVYDFKTGARRTLPRPIYDPSPDGSVALTHDFERMRHPGTDYVGLPDKHAGTAAPAGTGVWKMDLTTGEASLIMSLEQMARVAFPKGYAGETDLYFFREGWNPSGTRFIAFLKNADRTTYSKGWSIAADGSDVRFFYDGPSHHVWQDDEHVFEGNQFYLYKDDGSGKAVERLAEVPANTDPTFVPGMGGDWILGDTYPLDGYQHLFLFHRPTKLFVPLAKLKSTAKTGIHRIDLHARTNRSGRLVCIDASHEGLGRQMYVVDIGAILDRPPVGKQ